jgi:D-arginine dehydrogenase
MQCDVLVIGAGISGASAGYELASRLSVVVVDAEVTAGYHSTGRSAALYTPNYGPPVVQRISVASRAFLSRPPEGFSATPLLAPRGQLTVATSGEIASLDPILALSKPGNEIQQVSVAEALARAPILRSDGIGAALYEPGVMDMDVAALHQGYLAGLRQRGGVLLTGRRIERLERRSGLWHATARDLNVCARIVVNAAGAWADKIAELGGVKPIGIVAKRRTAILVDAPETIAASTMPAIDFAGSPSYLKPDAGRIMASPGDQTPVAPQDIQPDDFDVAVLVDWLETATHIKVHRIAAKWAGLRSFVADDRPVVGFAGDADGFFWLAGQGGYGIMMAPALAQAAAGMVTSGELPEALRDVGVSLAELGLGRLAGHSQPL